MTRADRSEVQSEALARRAQQRDEEALAQLYERYYPRWRKALRRMLGPDYRALMLDSEDAIHDGIAAALSSLDRFEYRESGSFLAWVLNIARTKILERLRASRAVKRAGARHLDSGDVAELAHRGPTVSQIAAAGETEARIQDCLERLPERERQVLVLRRYLELDADAIREEMRLPSPGAARALLSRAQARLASQLDELTGGP